MNESSHPILIVCTTNTQPPAWLLRWMLQSNATLISHETPDQALRDVLHMRPLLALVQLDASRIAESTGLIAELHRRRPQIAVAAVAPVHQESLERAARSAGARIYIGGEVDLPLLRQFVDVQMQTSPRRPRLPPRHRIRGRPPPRAAR